MNKLPQVKIENRPFWYSYFFSKAEKVSDAN